jgi:hypothetical protein
MLVIYPLYWTAGCGGNEDGSIEVSNHCSNLTNYDRGTLANVVPDADLSAELIGFSGRLYAVVLCSWLITWYACMELKQEWIDILAMRRVYFLEYDHWKGRQEYWKKTLVPRSNGNKGKVEEVPQVSQRGKLFGRKEAKEEPDYLKSRDPWIPHPEQVSDPQGKFNQY